MRRVVLDVSIIYVFYVPLSVLFVYVLFPRQKNDKQKTFLFTIMYCFVCFISSFHVQVLSKTLKMFPSNLISFTKTLAKIASASWKRRIAISMNTGYLGYQGSTKKVNNLLSSSSHRCHQWKLGKIEDDCHCLACGNYEDD